MRVRWVVQVTPSWSDVTTRPLVQGAQTRRIGVVSSAVPLLPPEGADSLPAGGGTLSAGLDAVAACVEDVKAALAAPRDVEDLSAAEQVIARRLALYRCLEEHGWSPPADAETQAQRDEALLQEWVGRTERLPQIPRQP
jgi:hypothetical protein